MANIDLEKLTLLYEGKAKQVYQTDNKDEYIVHYKDDATAFNGEKHDTILGKGVLNNKISSFFFELLKRKAYQLTLFVAKMIVIKQYLLWISFL